jgi:hypothetical protein
MGTSRGQQFALLSAERATRRTGGATGLVLLVSLPGPSLLRRPPGVVVVGLARPSCDGHQASQVRTARRSQHVASLSS